MDFMAAVKETEEVPAAVHIPSVLIGYNDAEQACRVLRRMYLPEIERMKSQAMAHVVTDEASQNEAITMAGQAKKLAKSIEKKRKEVIEARVSLLRPLTTSSRFSGIPWMRLTGD